MVAEIVAAASRTWLHPANVDWSQTSFLHWSTRGPHREGSPTRTSADDSAAGSGASASRIRSHGPERPRALNAALRPATRDTTHTAGRPIIYPCDATGSCDLRRDDDKFLLLARTIHFGPVNYIRRRTHAQRPRTHTTDRRGACVHEFKMLRC